MCACVKCTTAVPRPLSMLTTGTALRQSGHIRVNESCCSPVVSTDGAREVLRTCCKHLVFCGQLPSFLH